MKTIIAATYTGCGPGLTIPCSRIALAAALLEGVAGHRERQNIMAWEWLVTPVQDSWEAYLVSARGWHGTWS